MAKSFKKFREEWEDDEWGNDDYNRKKDRNLENRRQKRRSKIAEKFSAFEDKDEE